MAVFDSARALVHPVPVGGMSRWRLDGNVMIQDGVDAQGRACRATVPWRAASEGVVVYDTAVLEGPGCTGTSSPPATSTQLSPLSDAGLKIAAGASDPAVPVTDPVQFDGVWLLRGTGLLLAFDEVPNNGGGYFLDHNGDIDWAPDTQGKVEMGTDGLVTLTSPSCSDTLLRRPVLHSTSNRRSLTVTVEDDPCFWFGGEPVATLIKVL